MRPNVIKEVEDLIARVDREMRLNSEMADDPMRAYDRRDQSDLEFAILHDQRRVLERALNELREALAKFSGD